MLSKILLKFLKINHRHQLDMNLDSLHEIHQKKARHIFNAMKLR